MQIRRVVLEIGDGASMVELAAAAWKVVRCWLRRERLLVAACFNKARA
jgi:hypothetical protein